MIQSHLVAALRRLATYTRLKSRAVTRCGQDIHVGKGTRFWAPVSVEIGDHVYIGKHVHIEANTTIGDYCLIANRVAFVGRRDHDFRVVGVPVRFSPWIGSQRKISPHRNERAVIEADVWVGYGTIILTGVTVGRGAVIAAGSIVTRDIPPYKIAAGVPAMVIGDRFESADQIQLHESKIAKGNFSWSERGYDYATISLPE